MNQQIIDSVNAELAKQNPPVEPVTQDNNNGGKVEPVIDNAWTNNDKEPVIDKPDAEPGDVTDQAKKDDKDNNGTELDIDSKFKPVSYKRFKDINEKYKKLKEDYDNAIKNRKEPEFEDEDDKQAYDNFKKMGFADKNDMEIEKIKIQEQQLKEEEQRELSRQITKLEKEFNGSDGLPEFKKDEVLARWLENQVFDPQSAYIIMNLKSIINHFVDKAVKSKSADTNFSKSNETKQPDISGKEKKLSDKDGSLQNHLKSVIQGMLG